MIIWVCEGLAAALSWDLAVTAELSDGGFFFFLFHTETQRGSK